MALAIWLLLGQEGTFTLEQPSSSLIMRHRRMQQLLKIIRVPGLTIWQYTTLEDVYTKVRHVYKIELKVTWIYALAIPKRSPPLGDIWSKQLCHKPST